MSIREPRAAREARLPQGLVLIALAWVSTAAVAALGPVLPTIAEAFKTTPGVDLKIPLVATGPALLVAVLAVPCGFLADRIGRLKLLLATLGLYGAAGIAPLFLKSLDAIVVSRLAVGLAEAAIMTCGTALISDYFQGRRRERWLAAQAGVAPLTAVVFLLLSGLLGGAIGWRGPFLIYAWGFMLIPLVLLFLWEPKGESPIAGGDAQETAAAFSWLKPLGIALVIVLSMIPFMIMVVQFSFLVTERGMTSPRSIGLWSGLVMLFSCLGALLFAMTKGRTATKLAIAYVLFALGLAIMALVPTVQAAIVGAAIANLGGGFLLPTEIAWLLSTMPAALRGRGSGLWTAANFLGQFLGPLASLALVKITGSLDHAILAVGGACALAAIATGLTALI